MCVFEDSAEAVILISVFLLLSFSITFTQTKDAVLFNTFLSHNPALKQASQPWSGASAKELGEEKGKQHGKMQISRWRLVSHWGASEHLGHLLG